MSDWFDAEEHVERAHELYEAGRWEEAESLLRRALALNPYHAEWHFNLGLTLEAAGRFDDATSAFKDAFELGPEDPQAAMMVGVSCLRAQRYKESIPWLEAASKLDAKDPAPFIHRIEAYAGMGEHEQAELMFYMAQQLAPDNAGAYAALADSLLDREQYDKAVWCLREAARLDPEMPRIQARLAEAYARTGRHERARQLYLRELRRNPGDIDTLLDLGELLVEMNRPVEAGEKFRRVLEIEPDNADAHHDLGDLAQRQRNVDEALVHFDVVLRLDPDYPAVRRRLAGLLLDRGRGDDAARARDLLLREVGELRRGTAEGADPFSPEDLEELGQLLLEARAPAEAIRVFRRLLELRPSVAQCHHLLSVAYFEVGNLHQGAEEARRALRLEPKFVPAMHNMALACMQQRQWSRARYWLVQARRIDPDDASLRRLLLQLRLHAVAEVGEWCWRKAIRRRKG
jgi:tetratricopeptide (TPR) repeat protein